MICDPLQEYNNKGQLVPDDVVTEMVKHRIAEPDAKNGFILVCCLLYGEHA